MKKEALIALYYYSQNQVIPPEKIPHLMKFIEMHVNEIQNGPAENPRLIQ
jgi:hypothetical protein